jgi:hypothetical protein
LSSKRETDTSRHYKYYIPRSEAIMN